MGDLGGMFGGGGEGSGGNGGSTGGPVSSSATSGNVFGDFGSASDSAGTDRLMVWVGIAAAAAMVLIVGIVALKR